MGVIIWDGYHLRYGFIGMDLSFEVDVVVGLAYYDGGVYHLGWVLFGMLWRGLWGVCGGVWTESFLYPSTSFYKKWWNIWGKR